MNAGNRTFRVSNKQLTSVIAHKLMEGSSDEAILYHENWYSNFKSCMEGDLVHILSRE